MYKLYMCDLLRRSFYTKSQLNEQKERTHLGENTVVILEIIKFIFLQNDLAIQVDLSVRFKKHQIVFC